MEDYSAGLVSFPLIPGMGHAGISGSQRKMKPDANSQRKQLI